MMEVNELTQSKRIHDLADDSLILIIQYLRASDIVVVGEVDTKIFSRSRVGRAIEILSHSLYFPNLVGSPHLRELNMFKPDFLYVLEVKCMLSSMVAPQPMNGKGYWISTSWIANAKKYYESLTLPDISSGRKAISRKQKKIRQRRGSDSLPPWLDINAEIACRHGHLAAKSKRRLIDVKSWKFLRRFYANSKEYYAPRDLHCTICSALEEDVKASNTPPVIRNVRKEKLLPPLLEAVFARKSGVPNDHISWRVAMFNDIAENGSSCGCYDESDAHLAMTSAASFSSSIDLDGWSDFSSNDLGSDDYFPEAAFSLHADDYFFDPIDSYPHNFANASPPITQDFRQPLIPGIYALVPRSWLKKWRSYVKDTVSLPPLDCTLLLCPTHHKLIIPPHLEEYLIGIRRNLLTGLGHYGGLVVEVLSIDEWDALIREIKHGLPEFSISFSLDGDDISWSTDICLTCSPLNVAQVKADMNAKRTGANPQPIRSAF